MNERNVDINSFRSQKMPLRIWYEINDQPVGKILHIYKKEN